MERFLIYFWATQCGQFVKIGYCESNLYHRGTGINSGCPQGICAYPIGVIVCEDKDDMLKTEKALHRQFKAYRANGEWFELVDEISDYIREFTDTESGKRFVEKDREDLRERLQESDRERYQNNPEVRKRHSENQRKRMADPEYRKRHNQYQRKAYAHKKRENQPINGQQLQLF